MRCFQFNNKTNGITHRRWLLKANPQLSSLLTEAIGDKWIHSPIELVQFEKFASDVTFKDELQKVKQIRKNKFSQRK